MQTFIGTMVNSAQYLYGIITASLFTITDICVWPEGDHSLVLWSDTSGSTRENEVVGIYDPYITLSIFGNSHTYQACPPQRYTDLSSCRHSGSQVFNSGESMLGIVTYPKYRKGHILKCLMSTLSSFSARLRSFRGRPRPRGAGAFDLGLVTGVG